MQPYHLQEVAQHANPTETHPSKMSLSTFLKLGSAFALATGSADVLLGGKLLESAGPFPIETAPQIFADSQMRFLGGMW